MKPKALADGIAVWCSHDEIGPLEKAIENPKNPNKHPEAQIKLLANIIKVQGWRNPITISKLSGFITKGAGRRKAAELLGVSQVPLDYQDYENEAAEYADLIADNRIAELAEPDLDLVKDILESIEGLDAELTGYNLDELLKEVGSVEIPEDDNFDEDPDTIETDIQVGQIFQLGKHRLMCGDATNDLHINQLMGDHEPEFVFTDPPYDLELKDFVKCILSVGQTQLLLMVGFKQMIELFTIDKLIPHFDIIYVRMHCRYRPFPNMKVPHVKHTRLIYFTVGKVKSIFDEHNAKGAFSDTNFFPSVVEESTDPEKNEFFNQKDLSAICKIISGFSFNVMLDPFCGAGTFLMACEKMGKTCLGMELLPKNCQMIIDRWEQATGQKVSQ